MMGIAEVLAEGRLIREEWESRDSEGRQLLCLYTAMLGDPEARPRDCPADVCPLWLAHMIPWIDDAGSKVHWHSVVARVARLAPHFGRLPVATEWRVRALCVREAMRHTDDEDVLAACERVAALCETGTPDPKEREAAEAEAGAALEAAEAAAREAAAAAAEAALEAARDDEEWEAGEAASDAASEAIRAARHPREAADRLIDALLDEIERSLEAA